MLGLLVISIVIIVAVYFVLDWLLHSPKITDFNERYVIITGCDSGFGKQSVMRLDLLGFHVFAGCLTEEGQKCLSEICSNRMTPALLDVTREDSIQSFVGIVKQKLPAEKGIWALLNNAGVLGNPAPVEVLTKQEFMNVIEINLLGHVEMVRLFLPLIRKSRGRIINMSSEQGRFAMSCAPYSVSKFGVEAFSDVLRREVYRQGISVSIIEPGGFKTDVMNADRAMKQVEESVRNASSETQQIYNAEYLNKRRHRLKYFSEKRSPNLDPVVDAYTHAVTAKFPRTRYVVGYDARFFMIPLSMLPDWLSDWVMRTVLNLV